MRFLDVRFLSEVTLHPLNSLTFVHAHIINTMAGVATLQREREKQLAHSQSLL